jgi:hypothetical protein
VDCGRGAGHISPPRCYPPRRHTGKDVTGNAHLRALSQDLGRPAQPVPRARYAQRLLADQPAGLGYLLKERVSDIAVLVDAMRQVTEGECVIDEELRGIPPTREGLKRKYTLLGAGFPDFGFTIEVTMYPVSTPGATEA